MNLEPRQSSTSSLIQEISTFSINFAHDVSSILSPLTAQSTSQSEKGLKPEFPPPTHPHYIRDIVKWQWILSHPKPIPSTLQPPRPPTSSSQSILKSQQFLSSHFGPNQIAPSVYDPLVRKIFTYFFSLFH